LSPFELESVEACARQLGLVLEREQVRLLTEEKRLLEASDRLYRVILDAVSHELKSPLTSLSIIAENFASVDGRDRATVGQEMRTATRRLQRLVNNLLDQARLESGALRPKLDWSNPADVVNAAINHLRDHLCSHRLEVTVQPELPPVRMDAALMEHVLSNLLLNAILHTPKGTPISIGVRMGEDRKAVVYEVADQGPGLPPAMQQNLFKKFARADGSPAGGLGLGLSIVRGFMAAQGGEVTAATNPGGGARFLAWLPFVAHEALLGEDC
jgi:two-component system sensor histidine kinase KdpD